jgi:protein dithiol oxidoreductase (disulfide-forming)
MQRRQLLKTATSGAALAALGGGSFTAAAQPFVAGEQFKVLKTPVVVGAGKTIEVVEFFLFTCPHCNRLEAPLAAWLAKQKPDVKLRKEHMIGPGFGGKHQQFFYSLVAMGVEAQVIPKMFAAIHQEAKRPKDLTALADIAASAGVDKQKFLDVFKSFTVSTRMKQSDFIVGQYKVEGVPAFGVNGRYSTSLKMAGSDEKVFLVLDQLVAQERQRLA